MNYIQIKQKSNGKYKMRAEIEGERIKGEYPDVLSAVIQAEEFAEVSNARNGKEDYN